MKIDRPQRARRERREEERDRREQRQLRGDQQHRDQQPRRRRAARRSDARTLDGSVQLHVAEHQIERRRHRRDVDDDREHETDVLADDELPARQRLGQQAVDAAPLDLARDEADADEHRHQHARHLDRREPEVLDDLDVLPRRDLADRARTRRRAAARTRRSRRARGRAPISLNTCHATSPMRLMTRAPRRAPAGTRPRASSAAAPPRRATRRRPPARPRAARGARRRRADRCSGRPRWRRKPATFGRRAVASGIRYARGHHLPAVRAARAAGARGEIVDRTGRDELAPRDDADAAAQQLGVREDVRAEQHRAALVAQVQDDVAHLAAADGIEARHRLVENHELGIVDERLREADALHHPLRVLPDRAPAIVGAQARRDRARAWRARARSAPR